MPSGFPSAQAHDAYFAAAGREKVARVAAAVEARAVPLPPGMRLDPPPAQRFGSRLTTAPASGVEEYPNRD